MINSLKTILALSVVMGMLAGCTSKTTQSDADTQDTGAVSDPVVEPVDTSVSEPVDITAGVDTVFYFDFDQSILKSEARSALMIHAEALNDSPSSIRLEGHADERGSREYNMALGERRANAVRDFLVLQGVDSDLIETVSYGEERPAEVGSYDSAWGKNRRVELTK